jgi:hypothetical protein
MYSLKRTKANRLNSQKSTGFRSLEGEAAIRFNALKTGIDAKSQVIPGEDAAALELLVIEYHDRFQPATPEARALVDTLVTAEWLQRRFRSLRDNVSDHLQRRADAAERTFHRTLETLLKIQSRLPQPTPNQPLSPEIGLVPSEPPATPGPPACP